MSGCEGECGMCWCVGESGGSVVVSDAGDDAVGGSIFPRCDGCRVAWEPSGLGVGLAFKSLEIEEGIPTPRLNAVALRVSDDRQSWLRGVV